MNSRRKKMKQIKIKLQDEHFNLNTLNQWNNRCAIWGKQIAETKDRKVPARIRKHIQYLEKQIRKEQKRIKSQDKLLQILKSSDIEWEYA